MAVPALPAPVYRPFGLPLVPLMSSLFTYRAGHKKCPQTFMQAVIAPVPGPLAAFAVLPGERDSGC